jgi:hypothetical protein
VLLTLGVELKVIPKGFGQALAGGDLASEY